MAADTARPARSAPTELIVALDYSKSVDALALVDRLQGVPVLYKVGTELFLHDGAAVVRELVHRKCRVFLDLKFHDIPNTVAKAAGQAARLRVEMFTIHLAGGRQMANAVARELDEIPDFRPKVLGVSVLTSFDDVRWGEVTRALTGHAVSVDDSVAGLVDCASSWGVGRGVDGVVCSALELESVTEKHPSLYTVVPGIRFEDETEGDLGLGRRTIDDQARVVTPARARELGAKAIVMGRPITQSADPRASVERALRELG